MARAKKTNLILTNISGQIGKQLVIKQYAYGTVVSNYPDMSRVKRSKLQQLKHDRFKCAVAYAKAILRDPKERKDYEDKLEPGKSVYHSAIAEYLRRHP